MQDKHFTDELINAVAADHQISEQAKNHIFRQMVQLKKTKVNILIVGATGSGKSSTINALFNAEKAKVGQGVEPQTMGITKYEFQNLVLFDSPGLGDGIEADARHAVLIRDILERQDAAGDLLIDLVLVILDGGSRDLGTTFEMINKVIIPAIGEDTDRLLVAINQADQAMKGRYWDPKRNEPMPELVAFLDEKVASTQRRIFEATGQQLTPIYYCAGFKEGDSLPQPYNLTKLLLHIMQHIKSAKRAVLIQDINKNPKMWQDDDRLADYRGEVQKTVLESIREYASNGAKIGEDIGSLFGSPGAAAGRTVGYIVGGVCGFISSWF